VFKKILLAYDGSDGSKLALEKAADVANPDEVLAVGGRLRLWPEPTGAPGRVFYVLAYHYGYAFFDERFAELPAIEVREGRQWFRLLRTSRHEEMVGEFSLQIPGRFNVMNALAALAVALEVGVGVDVAAAVLESFSGIWRRFEHIGEDGGAVVISDYGHHPSAVGATLEAAREFYPDRRIVLIFQPHHHHRTKALFGAFVRSFTGADVLILPEIYSVRGREGARGEVSSQDLVRAVREAGMPHDVHYGGTLDETERLVRATSRPGDLLLFMGAGDIDLLARRLVQ